jgi:hypothetical protein
MSREARGEPATAPRDGVLAEAPSIEVAMRGFHNQFLNHVGPGGLFFTLRTLPLVLPCLLRANSGHGHFIR